MISRGSTVFQKKELTSIEILDSVTFIDDCAFAWNELIIVKKSGKDIDRDNYGKLKTQVRKDDIIVCTELDRFARSKLDIKNELQYFKSKGVKVIFLDDSENFEKVNDIFEMVNNILIEVIATMAEKNVRK